MNETITGARPAPESPFESSARAMSEFVVRAAILPVTLLFSKPRDLARGAESGDYRLLPTPFLLALITGVVVSGVTSNLDKFRVPTPAEAAGGRDTPTDFVTAVTEFYMNMDGVQAILFSLPYIFGLWALSSLLSFFMLRGIAESQTLFAPLSWALTSIVELTIVAVAVSFLIDVNQGAGATSVIFLGFMIFTLLLAVKLIRLILVLRKERNSHWAGAVAASAFALLVVFIAGALGSGVALSTFNQRVFVRQIWDAEADGRRTEALYRAGEFMAARDYDSAIVEYGKAIEAGPANASNNAFMFHSRAKALMQKGDYPSAIADYESASQLLPNDPMFHEFRCRARTLAGQQLDKALADCSRAIELSPTLSPALEARAMVQLRLGEFEKAAADFDAALAEQPDRLTSLYGRGVAQYLFGKGRDGERDMSAAVAREAAVATQFKELGFDPQRHGVPAPP